MEASRKSRSVCGSIVLLPILLLVMAAATSADKITVGGRQGWSPNFNYTLWAQDKHFYYDDWLFFVYDRNQQNVLEVNQSSYESCNAEQFLHNYTTGAGRDVVHLNVTRSYYFISGNGFCYSGMKLAIHVEQRPPPPPPPSNNAPASLWRGTFINAKLVIPAAFALWNSL